MKEIQSENKIKYNNKQSFIQIENTNLNIKVLNTGDFISIKDGDICINQLQGNAMDGMPMNVYLRIYNGQSIFAYPLLGKNSSSTFSYCKEQLRYEGEVDCIQYVVTFSLVQSSWFLDVELKGEGKTVDVIYAQDVAISSGVMSNEAYCSQYIDAKMLESENGYVLAFRQNQATSKGNAYFEMGSLSHKIVSYASDGYDFYGLTYKTTNVIEGLMKTHQSNRIYQYEFTMGILQSEKITATDNTKVTFYGHYEEAHKNAIQSLTFGSIIEANYKAVLHECDFRVVESNPLKFTYLSGKALNADEVLANYTKVRHQEYDGDTLLSFFASGQKHIVLQQKENVVERVHGHILLANMDHIKYLNKLSATVYMYGVFPSQIICGNTNMNKLNSNVRNALNVQKLNGQRIWLKEKDGLKLLGMPSYFEIGLNCVKWVYVFEDDTIEVRTSIATYRNQLQTRIRSKRTREFLITNQIVMGGEENTDDFYYEIEGNSCTFYPSEESLLGKKCQDIKFSLHFESNVNYTMDSLSSELNGVLCASVVGSEIQYGIVADIRGNIDSMYREYDFAKEHQSYIEFYAKTLQGFKLEHEHEEAKRMNDLVFWYTHNMMVHYQSPHGLEQYGGAAWGSRDVSQGPIEYYLATQNFNVAKNILLEIFSHQFSDDGSWPQWFMFDEYQDIFASESHGDIIVWPLYALAQYLERTNNIKILKEEVPYMNRETKQFEGKATILDHIVKELQYIEANYLNETKLSSYGDGDWDDTLQPANASLRKTMVSGWTTSLTYDAFKKMGTVLQGLDDGLSTSFLKQAEAIREDYLKYVVKDGVVAGFLHFDRDKVNYLLHPSDHTTGLNYRLLPMTRSIIGELFDKEMASKHIKLIEEKLYHPDGVRLMNTTCRYQGGVNTYFMRAETAANFGREIGLQYVHAHIRYVEAMAKYGKSSETWKGLMKINPIQIKESVTNAQFRQANAYFSSSDGSFANRYEAMEKFDLLRTGGVVVKGGWRIYSSGPGIYLNQLISNVLGVRVSKAGLELDPILPEYLDGMKFRYAYLGKNIEITYHLKSKDQKVIINDEVVTTRKDNVYREGAFIIPKNLITEHSKIDIYL